MATEHFQEFVVRVNAKPQHVSQLIHDVALAQPASLELDAKSFGIYHGIKAIDPEDDRYSRTIDYQMQPVDGRRTWRSLGGGLALTYFMMPSEQPVSISRNALEFRDYTSVHLFIEGAGAIAVSGELIEPFNHTTFGKDVLAGIRVPKDTLFLMGPVNQKNPNRRPKFRAEIVLNREVLPEPVQH